MGRSGDHAIAGYHLEADMTDVLIRNVPEEVGAALDAHAATPGTPVSVEDLMRFTRA